MLCAQTCPDQLNQLSLTNPIFKEIAFQSRLLLQISHPVQALITKPSLLATLDAIEWYMPMDPAKLSIPFSKFVGKSRLRKLHLALVSDAKDFLALLSRAAPPLQYVWLSCNLIKPHFAPFRTLEIVDRRGEGLYDFDPSLVFAPFAPTLTTLRILPSKELLHVHEAKSDASNKFMEGLASTLPHLTSLSLFTEGTNQSCLKPFVLV